MIIPRKLLQLLPDKLYIQLLYFKHFRRFVNFKHPVSFNEKLQWLKIYDRKPLYTTLVDKLKMKEYLREILGEDYAIPTLAVWDRPEDIDFDALPNQFVLKWNHDSGSIVICKDKSKFDKVKALKKLQHGAKYNGFWYGREWPYKGVVPKVFAEPYMEDSITHELRDYKVFTFNGEVKLLLIASERQKPGVDTKFDFYDMNMEHVDMRNQHENAAIPPVPPKTFPIMKKLAEKLSKGFIHLRVDFYEVDGKVYIGELTLNHGSGLMTFSPDKWYKILGDWIKLPTDN
jgi:hypothetical protein